MWVPLPMYTEAEARDYAEGCAERWCAAVQRGRRLTLAEWKAIDPPDMLQIPEQFWDVVHAVFEQRCGIRADAASCHWLQWYSQAFGRPRAWLEHVEDELREYDAVYTELTDEELRGERTQANAGKT